jgi:hypothetical protein
MLYLICLPCPVAVAALEIYTIWCAAAAVELCSVNAHHKVGSLKLVLRVCR